MTSNNCFFQTCQSGNAGPKCRMLFQAVGMTMVKHHFLTGAIYIFKRLIFSIVMLYNFLVGFQVSSDKKSLLKPLESTIPRGAAL